jgi:hypothetical protein
MCVIFTATADVSAKAARPEFRAKLEALLKRELGSLVKDSVEFDGPVTAEPGDPHDLM